MSNYREYKELLTGGFELQGAVKGTDDDLGGIIQDH
jgi:hypothetical protein